MLSRIASALSLLLALGCGVEPDDPPQGRWRAALDSARWQAPLDVSKLSARWHPQIASGALTWWTAAEGAEPGPEPAATDRAALFVAVRPSSSAELVEQRLDRAFLGALAAPAASPDGTRLAVSAQFDKSGRTQLRLFVHDGAGTWSTVRGGVEQPRSRPEWSPDGDRLAVLATDPPESRGGDTWVLLVCDRDGVPQDRVALGTYDRSEQAAAGWSPDGEALLLVVDGEQVDEVIGLGDTDLLLTVASRTVPGGFSPRPSMYVPRIHSISDDTTELLFDHGRTHHLNTGNEYDGLSEDVRRSFALWGRQVPTYAAVTRA